MAKKSLVVLLGIFFLLLTLLASAQSPAPGSPRWASEKGYWIVESNIKTPMQSTVYFYNNDGVLVYKEKVEGVRLRMQQKKTLIRLTSVLEQSISAWEKERKSQENQQWVVSRMGH